MNLDWEALIRGLMGAGVLALFVGLEARFPARPRLGARVRRWPTNLALGLCYTLTARLFGFAGAVGAAVWADAQGIGLLNWFSAPAWLAIPLSLIALDLALYAQHRAMHRVPWLWRFHRVHHADPDVDATTALRFHPGELLISTAWKAVIVALLGVPAVAVIAFEALVNACAVFNHANLRLAPRLERAVGAVLFTPALHRLHHEKAIGAEPGNYGFSTPLWDHLFASFRRGAEPEALGITENVGDPAKLSDQLSAPFQPPVR